MFLAAKNTLQIHHHFFSFFFLLNLKQFAAAVVCVCVCKCVVMCTMPTIPICRMKSSSLACTKLRPWNNVYIASCVHFFVVSYYYLNYHLFGHVSCSFWLLFELFWFTFCHHRRLVKCMGQAHMHMHAGGPFN